MLQFPLVAGHFATVYAVVCVLVSRNTECWEGVVCCCSDCLFMTVSGESCNPAPSPFWVELANMQSCSFPDRQVPEKTVFEDAGLLPRQFSALLMLLVSAFWNSYLLPATLYLFFTSTV